MKKSEIDRENLWYKIHQEATSSFIMHSIGFLSDNKDSCVIYPSIMILKLNLHLLNYQNEVNTYADALKIKIVSFLKNSQLFLETV